MILKRICIALAFIAFFCAMPVAARAAGTPDMDTGYLDAVRDMPLMPGLAELSDESFIFDKPHGRIVEATAVGHVADNDVRGFYTDTLPQLGWMSAGSMRWLREDEKLEVTIRSQGGETFVHFRLSPVEP